MPEDREIETRLGISFSDVACETIDLLILNLNMFDYLSPLRSWVVGTLTSHASPLACSKARSYFVFDLERCRVKMKLGGGGMTDFLWPKMRTSLRFS